MSDLFFAVGADSSTGGTQAARDQYQRVFEIARQLGAADPAHPELQRDLSTAYYNLGNTDWQLGDYEPTAAFYRQSRELDERRLAADPANSESLRDVMLSSEKVGQVLTELQDYDAAQRHVERMLRICEQRRGADGADRQAWEITRELAPDDPSNPRDQSDRARDVRGWPAPLRRFTVTWAR